MPNRLQRRNRIRSKVIGSAERPRLAVFRSNRYIYAQLIDDERGVTLVAANDLSEAKKKLTKVERAKSVGAELAAAAKAKKISAVVFDRGGYRYAGRVRALADGARAGGLPF
jgi:large subunit ribosomal protein L18